VLAFYAALIAGGLIVGDQAAGAGYSLTCVLAFALYCGARPHHRWEVFLGAFAPGAVAGAILEPLVGIALSGPPVVLGVLIAMFLIDRRADDALLPRGGRYVPVSSGAPPNPS
jgi:hypothetical protein